MLIWSEFVDIGEFLTRFPQGIKKYIFQFSLSLPLFNVLSIIVGFSIVKKFKRANSTQKEIKINVLISQRISDYLSNISPVEFHFVPDRFRVRSNP